ncbi:hypothetical protein KQ51_00569 [Candidatus Izimaplasma bacterium HR1]|jgi:hypothetical protein|nr:hypothetical protein KQ51_00569 [Candidatus Izimaplasma bacterium HR1]
MKMYDNYTIEELIRYRKQETKLLLQSNKKQIRSYK